MVVVHNALVSLKTWNSKIWAEFQGRTISGTTCISDIKYNIKTKGMMELCGNFGPSFKGGE